MTNPKVSSPLESRIASHDTVEDAGGIDLAVAQQEALLEGPAVPTIPCLGSRP